MSVDTERSQELARSKALALTSCQPGDESIQVSGVVRKPMRIVAWAQELVNDEAGNMTMLLSSECKCARGSSEELIPQFSEAGHPPRASAAAPNRRG